MIERKAWQPKVTSEPELNPFENGASERDALLESPKIRDATKDTAPLQGSEDLSDDDSLE